MFTSDFDEKTPQERGISLLLRWTRETRNNKLSQPAKTVWGTMSVADNHSAISTSDEDSMWHIYNQFHYFCDTHRYQKILARADLVKMSADVPGDIVDCGTFKGISTIEFAQFLKIYRPNSHARVISFDTFKAIFPRVKPSESAYAANHAEKLFEASAFDQLSAAVKRLNIADRIELVAGDIVETLPAYISIRPGLRISLLHCDLDVFEATKSVLEAAWPRISIGGVVVFDQYAVDGWGESDAADAFLSTLPGAPRLRCLAETPTPTAYLIKDRH